MIATIVFSTIAIICIIAWICTWIKDSHDKFAYNEEDEYVIFGVFIFISLLSLGISLCLGRSARNYEDKLFEEKKRIELYLDADFGYDTIKMADRYNRNVETGNNLWCRFKKEDRTEYKIDLKKWLNKEHKDGLV